MRGIGNLKHFKNIEPFKESEIIRMELVKDFIVELMLAAKFTHLLPCVLGSILVDIVGV